METLEGLSRGCAVFWLRTVFEVQLREVRGLTGAGAEESQHRIGAQIASRGRMESQRRVADDPSSCST